jgi:hypothetical protein
MRCYFMLGGRINAVEFLTSKDDQGRIAEAQKLFDEIGKLRGADGFEVWDGARFVYRSLPHLQP